jgi:hypothetical protein
MFRNNSQDLKNLMGMQSLFLFAQIFSGHLLANLIKESAKKYFPDRGRFLWIHPSFSYLYV